MGHVNIYTEKRAHGATHCGTMCMVLIPIPRSRLELVELIIRGVPLNSEEMDSELKLEEGWDRWARVHR